MQQDSDNSHDAGDGVGSDRSAPAHGGRACYVPGARQLDGVELLVLQLWARGYTLGQIAQLFVLRTGNANVNTGITVDTASARESLHCTALGCATSDEAVAEARRQGLIL